MAERLRRAQQVERNILAQTVAVTDEPTRAAASLRRRMPQLTVDQVADIPTVLPSPSTSQESGGLLKQLGNLFHNLVS